MAEAEPRRATLAHLLRQVMALLTQEFIGFDGPCDLAMRAEGEAPDRSVFGACQRL